MTMIETRTRRAANSSTGSRRARATVETKPRALTASDDPVVQPKSRVALR
jgi:hypothetical protein